MLKEFKYTSSIKDMPFMFLEMKRTALLMCDGKTKDEIISLSLDNNIYQLDKEKRRRELPQRMLKRLSTLNRLLIDEIAHGSDIEAKLIAFLALMKSDRLVFEYMHEVYSDIWSKGIDEVTDRDFSDFIERKAQNSETVGKWSARTLMTLCSTIKNMLCEAGLAKKNGNNLIIQRPIVDDSLYRLFDETDKIYAEEMLIGGKG